MDVYTPSNSMPTHLNYSKAVISKYLIGIPSKHPVQERRDDIS